MKQVGYIKDHWTCVEVPRRFFRTEVDRAAARDWCTGCESTGKFWAGYLRYYFENPEDAAMYVLRWS